jgi:chemotaxis protein histidine kinase CheA
MDSEKQKQILGYFIEEASDHLNTIESSLVNLQETLADPEMMNELFRAAHSIKGGAAMLGITGMQHVSHNLEDSFKVLKDYPESKVDQDLQSLLLTGVDTLKDLLQLLHNPSESDEQITQETLANSEPLFAQLKSQISALIPTAIASTLDKSSEEARAMNLVFRVDVPTKLRVMLQLFKQTDRPSNRQQLQIICDHLYQMGEQFDLGGWCDLVQMVKLAIANSSNTFRTLAPIIIREVKQAQESVLGLQAIAISPQLKALMPSPESAANIHNDDEISRIFSSSTLEPETNWYGGAPLERLRWQANGAWIDPKNVNYASSAPEGHLPAPIWLSGWGQADKTDELQDQVQKLMARIDRCIS